LFPKKQAGACLVAVLVALLFPEAVELPHIAVIQVEGCQVAAAAIPDQALYFKEPNVSSQSGDQRVGRVEDQAHCRGCTARQVAHTAAVASVICFLLLSNSGS
jgi:hypothetical protein